MIEINLPLSGSKHQTRVKETKRDKNTNNKIRFENTAAAQSAIGAYENWLKLPDN